MNHPSDTPTGPADLTLPLASAARSAATARPASGAPCDRHDHRRAADAGPRDAAPRP